MDMMIFSVGFAVLVFIVNLLAAYYWYKASEIEIDSGWRHGLPQSAADAQRPIGPGDTQLSEMGWLTATMIAVGESAHLNKIAARLTAVAVVLNFVSCILGALAGLFSPKL
jgi:hypothetical protein